MHTLYEWFLKLCYVSYPPEICSILKEYNNDTNLQIKQKSVFLWDSGGEGGGVGCKGSSQDLSLNLLSVKLVVGNWLHVC